MNTKDKWPPLNCLRGFEAAARLGSFSRAADSLHMTQSAISHQIKTLETYLDQPLFIRVNRKVLLSDAGRDLLATTEECLNLLDHGFRRLEQFRKPNQFILHTSSAFAANWLLARLGEYRQRNGDQDIWLYTTDDKPDLDLAEVHLAIVCGGGNWPGLQKTLLLEDCLLPLCSPDHPVMKLQDTQARDLLDHGLLHGEQRENWNDWFSAQGIDDADLTAGANFSDPALLLQAAAQGQGIALGSLVLAADLIDSGRLVSPCERAIPASDGYYLVSRYDGLESPLARPFADWLQSEAQPLRLQEVGDPDRQVVGVATE